MAVLAYSMLTVPDQTSHSPVAHGFALDEIESASAVHAVVDASSQSASLSNLIVT